MSSIISRIIICIETGIVECKNDRKGLNTASKRFASLIQKIPTVLSRLQWKTPAQPVLILHKLRLEGVLAFAAFLRDNFDALCSRRREITQKDFDWRRCFRVYQQTSPSGLESKSSDSSMMSSSSYSEPIRMQVMDDIFSYGNEFYGIHQTLCITSTTEKCFLGIWLALSFKRPVLVQGNAAVGKKYTITSFARFLGRFVATFECSQHVDTSAVCMFTIGLVSDGCWGIFNNIHTLTVNVLSPLAEYITLISDALRTNNSAATITSESKEIPIRLSVGIIATRNPFAINPNTGNYTILLSANSISFSPIEQRSVISLTSFIDLLQYVNNLKKHTGSRPTSMASSGQKIEDAKRSLSIKTPSYAGAKSDQLLIAQAFIDVIDARLNPDHAKTFRIFVLETLVGRDESKMTTLNTTSAMLDKIIIDKAADQDFMPKRLWVAKCVQMVHAANVAKNMILCGSTHSGKSSAAMLMVDVLTQMQQQQQLQTSVQQQKSLSVPQESNYAQEIATQTHKVYRINPLAIESENVLLGYHTLANDWQDGVLTTMLRKANRNCHTSWICFDGIISRTWANLLPSILEKESSLQIRNEDKLFLRDQVKFMFETLSLADASPSFVANSTIIYFDKSVIDWKVIAGAWLKD
ncbi:unnamed protein product [Rotaria sp. Silwood1]|nr:unnamed protein product [Rotaria sp. Silwood1]